MIECGTMTQIKSKVKILGIMGSPRAGGNTDLLLQSAEKGVVSGGALFETVRLREAAPTECDGCHVCWSGKPCARRDTMNDIYPKIAEADGVIFGTPVYWYAPTGLMKTFIDRFVYFNCEAHRGQIRGTRAATIIPFEETDPETVRPVLEFFERSLGYLGMQIVSQFTVPGVTGRGEVKQNSDALCGAEAVGRKLAVEIASS